MDGQNRLKRFLETRYENNIKVQTIKSLTNRKMHCNIRVLTWPLTMCRYHYHGRQKMFSSSTIFTLPRLFDKKSLLSLSMKIELKKSTMPTY